jgi:hypothetical protein
VSIFDFGRGRPFRSDLSRRRPICLERACTSGHRVARGPGTKGFQM